MLQLIFYFVLLLCLASVLLSTSFLCLSIPVSSELASSYECGFEPIGLNHVPFCINFFLLAIVFVVFDVEVAFLVPSLYSSTLMFSFSLVLIYGLLYEYAYGGLNWVI